MSGSHKYGMRYAELTEAALDPHSFGSISHGPDRYLHYAHTDEQIRAIEQHGFDLKHFGFTAKKFNAHEWAKDDPYGVFATEFPGLKHVDRFRPFVIFEIVPRPNVLSQPDGRGASANLRGELINAYGFGGKQLSALLLKHDIQVLHSIFEFIILDPSRIKILETSMRLKAAGHLAEPRDWR